MFFQFCIISGNYIHVEDLPISLKCSYFIFQGTSGLVEIFDRLASKLSGAVLRVKVDENNLLMQALSIYKDPKFDPTRPLTITFENQPAEDTGGPKREFYTQLFHGIVTSDGSVLPLMFEGAEARLMPSYNSRVVYSGMMKVVGNIIAHSIVQCGVGFPYLSLVCYWYLITGDVSKAISYGNTEDVPDIESWSCFGLAFLLQSIVHEHGSKQISPFLCLNFKKYQSCISIRLSQMPFYLLPRFNEGSVKEARI